MSGGKDNLIQVEKLNKEFLSGEQKIQVLKDVSFSIERGSFTIIYGPSGSGKSTLLNALTGLDKPTTGRILYENKDIYGLSSTELAHFRARTLGLVYQSNYWVKSLSILENVAISLYFLGYDKSAAEEKAMESLKRVGMQQHASKVPNLLSGGEQQRVAMARALACDPAYIVADEPTGNLDSKNGDMIIDLLKYFQKELKRTIILVTHNLEYLPLGKQLLFIQDGFVTETEDGDVHKTTDKLLKDMQERIHKLAGTKND